MLKKERGFSLGHVFVVIAVLGLVGAIGWRVKQASNSPAKQESVTVSKEQEPKNKEPEQPKEVEKFITHNPVDLSQIDKISKYRNCWGHDYSGLNAEGVLETNRSMKHYLEAIYSLSNSTNTVKIFAPFDGTIDMIRPERSPRGVQVHIVTDVSKWRFVIFHIDLLPQFKETSTVKAGELLGHAHVKGGSFDIALKQFAGETEMFDTPFLHMTDSVLQEYATRGVTLENIIISKETRDAQPCTFGPYRAFDWTAVQ